MVKIGSIEFEMKLIDNFTSKLKKIQNKAKSQAKSLGNSFKKAGVAVQAAWVAIGAVIGRVLRQMIADTSAAEFALARMQQQFKNVGIESEETVQAFKNYADQLQQQTGISNDAFISAAALSASYNLNAKQIKDLLPALADLTAFTTKSSGAQSELEDSVKLMGFVLEGQIGRLKLLGITMTDAQKEMIATGTSADRLAAFLQAIESNAGGVAEAMRDTTAGALTDFKNEMSDFGKEVGAGILPILALFGKGIIKLTKGFQVGVKALSAWAAALIAVATLPTRGFDKTRELLQKISDQLFDDIDRINKWGDATLESSEKSVEGKEKEIDTVKELNDEVRKLDDQRKNLILRMIQEGDESGRLQSKLDEINVEYVKNKNLLEDVTTTNNAFNESLKETKTQITELSTNQFDNLRQKLEGNIAAMEAFRDSDEENRTGLKFNQEVYDENIQRLKDLEDGNFDAATASGNLNKELESFADASKKGDDARKKLDDQLKELTTSAFLLNSELINIKNKLDAINRTDLNDKEATWTINMARVEI